MAILNMAVTGAQQVIRNIKAREKAMANGCERGLKLAGAYLLGKSKKMVPVEYGNLKASGFIRATGHGFKTNVNIGYTAFYAIFVHENVKMSWKGNPRESGIGVYWGPRGQAKFLERPAREESKTMRTMIRDSIKKANKMPSLGIVKAVKTGLDQDSL